MKSKTPVRLGKEEEFKTPYIPTIDRIIFYIILLVLFVGFIVALSYFCGYNSTYYYNSPLIHGGL